MASLDLESVLMKGIIMAPLMLKTKTHFNLCLHQNVLNKEIKVKINCFQQYDAISRYSPLSEDKSENLRNIVQG